MWCDVRVRGVMCVCVVRGACGVMCVCEVSGEWCDVRVRGEW